MYKYEDEKKYVFTNPGHFILGKIQVRALEMIQHAGVCRLQNLIDNITCSDWEAMACVDRLVELGILREIAYEYPSGQNRLFVKGMNFVE